MPSLTHFDQLALIRYLNEELLAYDSDRYEDQQALMRPSTPIMRATRINNPANPYAPLNFHSPIPTLPDWLTSVDEIDLPDFLR